MGSPELTDAVQDPPAGGVVLAAGAVIGVVGLVSTARRSPRFPLLLLVPVVTAAGTYYALGRNLESFDMPAVRAIVRDAEERDYRFSSVVLGIVQSTPFQMRMSQS